MKYNLLAGLSLAALSAIVPVAPGEEPKTVAAVLTASKEHKVLVEGISQTGLIDTIGGKGEWTVFAPTDAAFKRLDEPTFKKFTGDAALLKKFMGGHVVKGALTSADLVKLDGKEVETLSGTKFKVAVDGKQLTVGGVKVARVDLKAGNGVVHILDAALLPGE